ncbi:MAG: ATP-binding protein [Bacillota bacterium]|nr:ATP-binding protein [Bacillota bacterium]
MNAIHLFYEVSGDDFARAGEASGDVKQKLKSLGYDKTAIRNAAIAMYEGEINMVIHAGGGVIDVDIYPEKIEIKMEDKGPGIPDLDMAMQEGFSTAPPQIHDLGFGAGMGLPNIKKYTDKMHIDTELGVGTTVYMTVNANK